MIVKIEQSAFMDIEFEDHAQNCGNNSDRFSFKLRAEGQKIEVYGEEVDELAFDITGSFELHEFLFAMGKIKDIVNS